ncbi:MAG: enoyl-CoA hydratase/isomerase family protein [Halobacteriaceae archaeon]
MSVHLEADAGVATITVDRPERHNALNVPTLEALADTVAEAADRSPGCLVLRGAGEEAFIAGADISQMQDLSVPEARDYAALGQDLAVALETFPCPVIAAIEGYAFGGGMELALACDLRVAAEGSLMGQTELDLGIMPGWGATQRLPRLVGDETARRLVYFGERLDATDALEHGLVGEVVAPEAIDDRVAELAAELAAGPRHALRATKEAFHVNAEASRGSGLRHEARAWASLFGTADQAEGMAAFLEDREPDFG